MTFAPRALLDVRAYLKPIVGLSDVELGITPDAAHNGGYHCGWDQRRTVDGVLRDYSWNESPRDWNHKSNAARAFDFGWFSLAVGGRRVTLIDFNLWVVQQCQAGAPDTLDLREVIYTPDGKTVKRWDRLGKRTTGDSSHLGHTHMSYFADAEHRDKTSLFRRFFEHIGADMAIDPQRFDDLTWKVDALFAHTDVRGGTYKGHVLGKNMLKAAMDALAAKVEAIGSNSPEVAELLREIDERFEAQAIEIRDAVADLGEGGAAAVRADA